MISGQESLKLKMVYFFRAPTHRNFNDTLVRPGELYVELMSGGIVLYQGKRYRRATLFCHTEGDRTIHDFPDGFAYRALMILFENYHAPHRDLPHISRWNVPESLDLFIREALEAFHNPGTDRNELTDYLYSVIRWNARNHPGSSERDDSCPREIIEIRNTLSDSEYHYDNLRHLAGRAGYSTSYFKSLFKNSVGVSPYRFRLNARLQKACSELAGTNLPIREISRKYGFANIETFYRAFKKFTGKTPGAFRKDHFPETI